MTRLLLKFILLTTILCMLAIGAGVGAGQGRETSRLLFMREYDGTPQIHLLDVSRRIEQRLNINWSGVEWSPDGLNIAYFSETNLYIMDANGRNRRLLAQNVANCPDRRCWSPDSSRILVTVPYEDDRVYAVVDVEMGEMRQFTEYRSSSYFALWSPNGVYMLLMLRDIDGRRFTILNSESGETRLIEGSVKIGIRWSPNGQHISYSSLGVSRLVAIGIVNIETDDAQSTYFESRYSNSNPIWSPNGQYIAFNTFRETINMDSYLNIMNLDGDLIYFDHDVEGYPLAWLSDTRLMFVPDYEFQSPGTLSWVDISGETGIIGQNVEIDRPPPLLSPNRELVVYYEITTPPGGAYERIVRIATTTGEQIWDSRPLGFNDTPYYSRWSPNSRYLLFGVRDRGSRTDSLFILDIDARTYYEIDALYVTWQPCCE